MTVTAEGLTELQRVWAITFDAIYYSADLSDEENAKNLTAYLNQRTREYMSRFVARP